MPSDKPGRPQVKKNAAVAAASPPSSARRTDLASAGAIAAIALLVRIAVLLVSPDKHWPHSLWYEGDAPVWVVWANALAAGVPFEFDLPLRSPAAAYLLHWIHPAPFTPDFSYIWLKAFWCMISAAACGIAHLCFVPTIGRRAAWIASGMCVLSFSSIVLATSLNNENLYCLTLMLLILASLKMRRSGGSRALFAFAAIAGALHGIATLIRPEHTLLLAAMSMWSLRTDADPAGGRPSIASRVAAAILMIAISVVICLPWTFAGEKATHQFNQTARQQPDFTRIQPPLSADGRAFIESLPPYAQSDNLQFIAAMARANRRPAIDEAFARKTLLDAFGVLPEPLRESFFVSGSGPLNFALANHPEAHGEFSKAALVNRFAGGDPDLNFTMPSHVNLYNHGYAEGWRFIRGNPSAWLDAAGVKASIFSEGATLGFTSLNLPEGRDGIRRPVDIFTPRSTFAKGESLSWLGHGAWRLFCLAIFVVGLAATLLNRKSLIWTIAILYKLLVAIAFFGYARQAASVHPAFFAVAAMGIDAILELILRRRPGLARHMPRAGFGAGGAFLLLQLLALGRSQAFSVDPPMKPNPQLSRDAGCSVERVTIHPAATGR